MCTVRGVRKKMKCVLCQGCCKEVKCVVHCQGCCKEVKCVHCQGCCKEVKCVDCRGVHRKFARRRINVSTKRTKTAQNPS